MTLDVLRDEQLEELVRKGRHAQAIIESRKYKKDTPESQTCIVFLSVPAPRSGNIVDYLSEFQSVKEAAAVYTDTDVVAVIDGTQREVSNVVSSLNTLSPPVDSTGTQLVDIDCILQGCGYGRGRFQGTKAVFAFVRLVLAPHQPFNIAVKTMVDRFKQVRLVYTAKHQAEIIIQVFANDKSEFDRIIMEDIQKTTMFISTRSYIVINNLHWSDSGIPRTRNEFMQREKAPPLFFGYAEEDSPFACEFARNLEDDSGVPIWHYKKMHSGSGDWINDVNLIIDRAPAFILLVSNAFLDSNECQREFGNIEHQTRTDPRRMCVFVAPGTRQEKLDDRYRRRQYIDGRTFWGYRQLLWWLQSVV